MYKPHPQYSFANVARSLTPQNLEEAERFWITDAQKSVESQLERGDFNCLCPSQGSDGIIEVGGRVENVFKLATITRSWFCFHTIIDFPGYL